MLVVRRGKRRGDGAGSTAVADGVIPPAFRLMLGLSIVLMVVVVVLITRIRSGASGQYADQPLPVLKEVPRFSLTERDGRIVTPDDLLGSVWVAGFFFTSCTGPCPELSLRMRSLQEGLRQFNGEAKLVSFSVDPSFDTPAVLSVYAKRYSADPKLWWFLTTESEQAMHSLVKEGFLQALSPRTAGSAIIHTTQLLLVDQGGRIRTWYDGLDPGSKRLALRDVKKLLAEPTP